MKTGYASVRPRTEPARTAYRQFERTWGTRCPVVVRSLQEGGEELLTFFSFPRAQWKTLRTTNVIERLNEEFRRRVKTQGSLPTEDAALILLFGLVASGQITLRKIDGYTKIATVISRGCSQRHEHPFGYHGMARATIVAPEPTVGLRFRSVLP